MPAAPLAGLAMARMPPAPLAVLAQGDAVRVVALGLLGLVVPALALLAGEGSGDPDVSAGHDGVLRESVVRGGAGAAKENPAPARGRQGRIAPVRCRPRTGRPRSPAAPGGGRPRSTTRAARTGRATRPAAWRTASPAPPGSPSSRSAGARPTPA